MCALFGGGVKVGLGRHASVLDKTTYIAAAIEERFGVGRVTGKLQAHVISVIRQA